MATRVNLVVASGAHQGKTIPITSTNFVIGRDPDCNLRPASPAVSKKHTAIIIRDGKLLAKDLGSTNGTFVNDEQITEERQLANGDRLKLGPLDFQIQLVPGGKSSATTPAVNSQAEKPTDPEVSASMSPTTPDPMQSVKPPSPIKPAPRDADADAAAAMLLGMDDDDPVAPPNVPDGTTVHEMPAVDIEKMAAELKAMGDKKKVIPSSAETSDAANEILKKYMRRQK